MQKVQSAVSDAALVFGQKHAEKMFANRRGHGGPARVSERHLNEAQVAAIFALGYDAGAREARLAAQDKGNRNVEPSEPIEA